MRLSASSRRGAELPRSTPQISRKSPHWAVSFIASTPSPGRPLGVPIRAIADCLYSQRQARHSQCRRFSRSLRPGCSHLQAPSRRPRCLARRPLGDPALAARRRRAAFLMPQPQASSVSNGDGQGVAVCARRHVLPLIDPAVNSVVAAYRRVGNHAGVARAVAPHRAPQRTGIEIVL